MHPGHDHERDGKAVCKHLITSRITRRPCTHTSLANYTHSIGLFVADDNMRSIPAAFKTAVCKAYANTFAFRAFTSNTTIYTAYGLARIVNKTKCYEPHTLGYMTPRCEGVAVEGNRPNFGEIGYDLPEPDAYG